MSKIVHNRIFGPTILNTNIVNIFSPKTTTERVLRTPITIIHTPPPPITVIEDVVRIFLLFSCFLSFLHIFCSYFTWYPMMLGCNNIDLKGDRPWKDLWVNDNTTSSYNYHRGYCELRIWIEYLFNGFKYMIVYVMSSWSWFWKVTDPGIVESGECPLPKNSQFL